MTAIKTAYLIIPEIDYDDYNKSSNKQQSQGDYILNVNPPNTVDYLEEPNARFQMCPIRSLSRCPNVPKILFSRKCYFVLLCWFTIRKGYQILWIENPSALEEAHNLDRNHVNKRLRERIIELLDGAIGRWSADQHPVKKEISFHQMAVWKLWTKILHDHIVSHASSHWSKERIYVIFKALPCNLSHLSSFNRVKYQEDDLFNLLKKTDRCSEALSGQIHFLILFYESCV